MNILNVVSDVINLLLFNVFIGKVLRNVYWKLKLVLVVNVLDNLLKIIDL